MTEYREYRIVEFFTPSHIKTSGALASIEAATVMYNGAVESAQSNLRARRVVLYGYTHSTTEVLDEWRGRNSLECRFRHEINATIYPFTRRERVA